MQSRVDGNDVLNTDTATGEKARRVVIAESLKPPTDILLDGQELTTFELIHGQTAQKLYTMTSVDENLLDTHTYSILIDPESYFAIQNDDELWLNKTVDQVDFPTTLKIRTIDSSGLFFDKTWTPSVGFLNNFSASFAVDTYIDGGNIASYDNITPFTIMLWIKTTQVTIAHYINRIKSIPPFTGYQFYKSTDQKLYFSLINNNVSNIIQVRGGTSINTGAWLHAAATIDGSSDASGILIYVNGIVETMVEISNTLTLSSVIAQNLLIGKRSDGVGFCTCKMDEIGVFDRKLSAAEILVHAQNGPINLSDSDLHTWSRFTQFDKDNLPAIKDYSINGRDMIAFNFTTANIQGDVPV